MTDASVIDPEGGSFTVGFLLASQLVGYGRYAEADDALAEASARATADDDVAMVAAVRASNRFWRLGDAAGAYAVLDEAARRVGPGGAGDGVLTQRAVLLLFEGRTTRAVALSRAVRRRDRTSDAARLLATGAEALGRGLRGETGDLGALASELVAERSSSPAGAVGLIGFPALTALQRGVLGLSISLARALNGLDAVAEGDDARVSPAHAVMADACEGAADIVHGANLVWAGRVTAAVPVLRRAVERLRATDRFHVAPVALGELAYALALRGDAEGASRAAEEAAQRQHPVGRFGTFFVGRGGAWAAGARGELSAATAGLTATAEACTALGQPVLAAQAWYDLARFGEVERARPHLARLARWSGPDGLVADLAGHVAALAAGDADAVGRASVRAHQRGHRLLAAEAAVQAAVLHGRRSRADADRWAQRARALTAACAGARSPVLARLAHLGLTAREREVVGLVAQGLSNPDIARRLHLSVRTIENHLQAGYAKLGVHRREDVAHLRLFAAQPGAGDPMVSVRPVPSTPTTATDGDRLPVT